MEKEKPESPRRIPNELHLALSLVLGLVVLLASYLILTVLLDLISQYLFGIDLRDQWIGILSISIAFVSTYFWLRRQRRKTEPVNQKRNWRKTSNLIAFVFLLFLAFIAYRIYEQNLSFPDLQSYLPASGVEASDSSHSSIQIGDSLQAPVDSTETASPSDSL